MSQDQVNQNTKRTVIVDDVAQREHQNARHIVKAVRDAERKLRARWPILNYQNTIGMLFFAAAASGFATNTLLYLLGAIPAWLCIVGNGICISVVHELEHDLIHSLYFRGQRKLQNFLLLATWLFQPNSVNPLYRRKVHLLHHRTSGQVEDLELRLTGISRRFGLVRLMCLLDASLASLLRRKEFEQIPAYNHREFVLAGMPLIPCFSLFWYTFIGFHATGFVAWLCGWTPATSSWLASVMPIVNSCAVAWVLPNIVRHVCFITTTSLIHYYGDVEDTTEQIQVLTRWYLWPLQLFTANLGGTHAIHHFVVNQPFYLRQIVAPAAYAAMRAHGVRFNDMDTVVRGNRFHAAEQAS